MDSLASAAGQVYPVIAGILALVATRVILASAVTRDIVEYQAGPAYLDIAEPMELLEAMEHQDSQDSLVSVVIQEYRVIVDFLALAVTLDYLELQDQMLS